MLFMAAFQFGAEGGGPVLAARWQHGPTPGVTVKGAWVSTVGWGENARGQEAGRTFIVFEAESPQHVAAFVNYLHFVCTRIDVWPVVDYTAGMRALEERAPEAYPYDDLAPGIPDDVRQTQIEIARMFMAAANPVEAVRIWRELPSSIIAIEEARQRLGVETTVHPQSASAVPFSPGG